MPPPLKPEAAASKRRSILVAARGVAEQRGLEAAKMSDIAREAKVSKGTLYRFFESKEDLLVAMVLEGSAGLVEPLRAVRQGPGTPRERLRRMIEVFVLGHVEAIGRVMVDLQALGVSSRDPSAQERLARANESQYDEVQRELATVIAEGKTSGELRPDIDVDGAAAAMLAVRDGFIYRASFDEVFRDPARLRAGLSVLVDGVMCQLHALGIPRPDMA